MKTVEVLDQFAEAWMGVGARKPIIPHVLECYNEPHRAYHNWFHIVEIFNTKEKVIPEICLGPESIIALVMHDIVCQPGAMDNERMSAIDAADWMSSLYVGEDDGADLVSIERVRQLILATASHKNPTDRFMGYVLDLDLSILGHPYETFREYDAKIREEYRIVPNSVFNFHRADFLRQMLARDTIFHTKPFVQKLEGPARNNIRKLLREYEWTK